MRAKLSQSFKIQAVEKALSRSGMTRLNDVASSLGVGCSTLSKWIVKARNQEFDSVSPDEISRMSQDKRPQDWNPEERPNMVVACGSSSEMKLIQQENKTLKKEPNRKDKALAETAALLVLQKKSTRSGETTRTAHHEIRASRNH